jgi:hypothetical protein
MLGFGPAPAYVEHKPYENLINHYFQKYVAPIEKPEEQREMDQMKRFVREQVQLANHRVDQAAARQQGRDAGAPRESVRGFWSASPQSTLLPYAERQSSASRGRGGAGPTRCLPQDGLREPAKQGRQ